MNPVDFPEVSMNRISSGIKEELETERETIGLMSQKSLKHKDTDNQDKGDRETMKQKLPRILLRKAPDGISFAAVGGVKWEEPHMECDGIKEEPKMEEENRSLNTKRDKANAKPTSKSQRCIKQEEAGGSLTPNSDVDPTIYSKSPELDLEDTESNGDLEWREVTVTESDEEDPYVDSFPREPKIHAICPDCGQSFQLQSLYAVHRRMHVGARPFICSGCKRSFGHQSSLMRHRQLYCNIRTRKLANVIGKSRVSNSETDSRLYKCGVCRATFKNIIELKKHLGSHSGKQRYWCKVCEGKFSCNYFLVQHQRVHTGDQPYQCLVCQRPFSQKPTLSVHIRTHIGERPYLCQLCGYGFCSRAGMVRHQRSHKGSKIRHGNVQKKNPPSRIRLKVKPPQRTRKGGTRKKTVSRSQGVSGKAKAQEPSAGNEESEVVPKQRIIKYVECPDCGKTFKSQTHLTIHFRMHTGERPFACKCGKSFGHRSTLIRHRNFHCEVSSGNDSPERPEGVVNNFYKCGICHLTFPTSGELKKHLGSHTGDQRYTCVDCGRNFTSNFYLVRHQRTHTGERPFTCPQCSKSFKCSSVLYRHQRTHAGVQPFKCKVCDKGFSQKTSLIIHMRTHTGLRPFSCYVCRRTFCSSTALLRHVQSHKPDEICPGENFFVGDSETAEALKIGIEGESRLNDLEEDNSGKIWRTRTRASDLLGFNENCDQEAPDDAEDWEDAEQENGDLAPDDEESGFICPECGKFFRSQTLLSVHQTIHSTGSSNKCSGCGKVFGHRSSLQRHQNTCCKAWDISDPTEASNSASIQAFYKCGICCIDFANRNELRKHLAGHPADQRYTCNDCDRTFSCNYFLVRHQRTHTGERPFVCTQCNKSFKCSSVLYRHQRTHTGELPFKCDVCMKSFCQKSTLVIHLRTHTGERPYPCQMCSRSFCSSSALARHEQTHRNNKDIKLIQLGE